ncbi:adenylate cyclase [Ereboglobus sp. PH5-5]|uniref:adenylate/guanylate cyclase domain-containing protein n=1 Tax=Ereboglobus sp. PH5-5 TaxID=2940529 RepID=UPI0024063D58|nr:adenylate/guanylate cyclase domain-containing protein [Ereboglobus sp. PH5-5]MDF9833623.1 adenylate cyclase [Ereboglobus sp. PH5-5]
MRNSPFKWLILLAVTLIWCGVNYFGLLEFIEEETVDWRFQYRGELPGQGKIFYLDVDAKSIADIGNLAWDRAYYVDVCEAALKEGGASAIGIDYVFSDRGMPEIADRERFQKGTLRMAGLLFSEPPPPVVLAAGYASSHDRDINGLPIVREMPRVLDSSSKAQPPELPQIRVRNRIYTPPHVGLIDTIDGAMNRVPLFAPDEHRTWYHMSVELARLAWKLPQKGVRVHANRLEFVRADGVVLASVPLLDGQDVEVNWSTRWDSPQNARASFSDALAAAGMLKSEKAEEREAAMKLFERMRDSIVLIGPVDPLLQDRAPTRLDALPVPRVGLIGTLIRQFQSGAYVRRVPAWAQWMLIIGLTAGVCGLQLANLRGRWGVAAKAGAAALVVAYVWCVFFVFLRYNLILPLVIPLFSAFTTSFALTALLLVVAERMRSRITSFFGTYVSPALVQRMIESGDEPQLGGVEVPITAYFSDIQNFTMVAESLSPTRLVEFMNDYLSSATDVITDQEGTLDKYMGDAVVAMFGAPVANVDHALRACVATQLVHAKNMEIRERWPEIVQKMPVRSQIGLSTGKATVGNIGSRTRFDYTMMGDTVNIAARLENAARVYGVQTLVSGETREGAEKYGNQCVFRNLGKIVVKGRQHPVDIHEIMGLRDRLPAAALECKRVFEEGLEKFFARDWAGAAELFAQSAKLEWYPVIVPGQRTPSEVFLDRCEALKKNPPSGDWTGVYVMETK